MSLSNLLDSLLFAMVSNKCWFVFSFTSQNDEFKKWFLGAWILFCAFYLWWFSMMYQSLLRNMSVVLALDWPKTIRTRWVLISCYLSFIFVALKRNTCLEGEKDSRKS
ncbi:hypothetical protein I3842_14G093900 [Carya illinoinensis]|uniref:Uncharacterized protein n=1 Tax=Carya illinoinensis TaxID=32201 RepID=A0A922ACB2_CARIL|nr:hypothetical protein I3842_14G093900 [Carya illinoinensis]